MKKRLMIALLAVSIPLAVGAFPGGGKGAGGWNPEQKVERLSQQLNLTAEQKTQLEAFFKEQHAKHQALREERRARMQEILTEEQMNQLDQLHQRRREGRMGNKPCLKP